jgi:hypothetical protein
MGVLVVLSTIRTITHMLDILRAARATSRKAVSKGRFGSPLAIHSRHGHDRWLPWGLNDLKTAGKRQAFADFQGCSAILCLPVAAQTGAIGWCYSSGRSREDCQRR